MTAPRTVFVHIGAPKSGTTYLQKILHTNRPALRRDGLLYPGQAVRSHFWAAQDLRELRFRGHVDPRVSGAWENIVDEVRRFSGNAIIDHELFAGATEVQVDRALADLSFAEVHVIWTDRDLARQLPAAWQEALKNRETVSFAEYLDTVRAGLADPRKPGVFWSLHDAPAILRRWSRGLDPRHVHVVTVPPPGADPSLLWRRFAGVLGIDADRYESDLGGENTSLGAAEAAVLRDFNERIRDVEVPWPIYATTIKHGFPAHLGRGRGSRIELPDAAYAWSLEWSQRAAAALASAGYDVVGDLAELVATERPAGRDPDAIPPEERADAALTMAAAILGVVADRGLGEPGHGAAALLEPPTTGLVGRVIAAARRGELLAAVRRRYRARRGQRST